MTTAGIKGAVRGNGYSWPEVTAINLDRGAYTLHVHRVCDPQTGNRLLLVFNNSIPRPQQAAVVWQGADEIGHVVEQLSESDITAEVAHRAITQFADNPTTAVVLIPAHNCQH